MKQDKFMQFEIVIGKDGVQKNRLNTNMGAKQCAIELDLQKLRMEAEIIRSDRKLFDVKKNRM